MDRYVSISSVSAYVGRVDAPLTVVRPSQNPDVRLFRIRLFAKRIVHVIIRIR